MCGICMHLFSTDLNEKDYLHANLDFEVCTARDLKVSGGVICMHGVADGL